MSEFAAKTARDLSVCPTCGSRVTEGATRCAVCGTHLNPTSSTPIRKAPAQVTLSVRLSLVILAIFTFIAAGLTYGATRLFGGGASAEVSTTPTNTPTETATPEPTATFTLIPSPTPLPTLEYVIVQGDTFLGIAVRHDVSVQSILQLNPGLSSQSILSVGQRMNIPQPTPTPSPEPTATLLPDEATREACETVSYTVQANDTLSDIAENYNVNPLGIMEFNGMTSETVFLGQILIVPLCERNPTPGPSPTATPPPPYPAPNLLLPQDGAAFSLANDTITLQWASVGELRENETYRVTVEDVTEGTGTQRIVAYVEDTKYIVPTSFRPSAVSPHIMRWWIQVVRQVGTTTDGDPQYESGGLSSLKRDFTWSGAALAETPEP